MLPDDVWIAVADWLAHHAAGLCRVSRRLWHLLRHRHLRCVAGTYAAGYHHLDPEQHHRRPGVAGRVRSVHVRPEIGEADLDGGTGCPWTLVAHRVCRRYRKAWFADCPGLECFTLVSPCGLRLGSRRAAPGRPPLPFVESSRCTRSPGPRVCVCKCCYTHTGTRGRLPAFWLDDTHLLWPDWMRMHLHRGAREPVLRALVDAYENEQHRRPFSGLLPTLRAMERRDRTLDDATLRAASEDLAEAYRAAEHIHELE